MDTIIDLSTIQKKYKGKWIALDASLKRVVVTGTGAKKVYDLAIKKGYLNPTLFKVPQNNIPYFGNSL
ncbi:MAG: DUF5678 domain-containing protein [Patescibacteria group bacterium]